MKHDIIDRLTIARLGNGLLSEIRGAKAKSLPGSNLTGKLFYLTAAILPNFPHGDAVAPKWYLLYSAEEFWPP